MEKFAKLQRIVPWFRRNQAELRVPSAAAQTRMVSVARNQL